MLKPTCQTNHLVVTLPGILLVVSMEVISSSLSAYKVSKQGNESLLCIKGSIDEITLTLSEAKMLLESLSRLIEDRTITGPQSVYNFRECVNAGRIVKRG